jgi:hypothetical protein
MSAATSGRVRRERPQRPPLGPGCAGWIAAFLWGALSADPRSTWGIYLVNLLFWSSFAITVRLSPA